MQICDQCVFFWHLMPIEDLKKLPLATQKSQCWSQILVKMISRIVEEVSSSNVSVSWLQTLKVVMHFLLHWIKPASNVASNTDIIINKKAIGPSAWPYLIQHEQIHSGHPVLWALMHWYFSQVSVPAAWAGSSSHNMHCLKKGIRFVLHFLCQMKWCKVFDCLQIIKDTGIEMPDWYSWISVLSCRGSIICIEWILCRKYGKKLVNWIVTTN